jgi:hypothetical protein
MLQIKRVDVECVDVFWDKVKNWIEAASIQSNGRHTLESTYKLLKEGQMTMFLILKNKAMCAVYVVQKVFYPAKQVICILFCGGSKVIDNINKIEKFFINYAKEQKCNGIEIIGRKGWDKVIDKKSLNFKRTGCFYEVVT